MKTLKKALPVAAALVWALLLLPFFLGAEAAHPATDDFTFAVYTHPTWVQTGSILHVLKDALSYTLRTWRCSPLSTTARTSLCCWGSF